MEWHFHTLLEKDGAIRSGERNSFSVVGHRSGVDLEFFVFYFFSEKVSSSDGVVLKAWLIRIVREEGEREECTTTIETISRDVSTSP